MQTHIKYEIINITEERKKHAQKFQIYTHYWNIWCLSPCCPVMVYYMPAQWRFRQQNPNDLLCIAKNGINLAHWTWQSYKTSALSVVLAVTVTGSWMRAENVSRWTHTHTVRECAKRKETHPERGMQSRKTSLEKKGMIFLSYDI